MYGSEDAPGCRVLSTLISPLPKTVYVVVYVDSTVVGSVPLTLISTALSRRARTRTSVTSRFAPASRQVWLRVCWPLP
jgi:hypothetical protein